MNKVLIISYYFPPSGGPGVQRVLKFVKYLPEFGWEPVVLTVKDADFPARDESLLEEIPENIRVYRTKIFEPYGLYRKLMGIKKSQPLDVENIPAEGERIKLKSKLSGSIRSNFFIPDARIGWRKYAVKKGMEIIQNEKINLIYSSSPPYTCSVIARDLKRKLNLKWVAGFRDPWTGFLNTPKRKGLAKKIDAEYEYSCMKEADIIDVAWKGIKENILRKYPSIPENKIIYLPNGFDPDDFRISETFHEANSKMKPTICEASDEAIPISNKDRFTITYTGSMYGVRNPRSFLDALNELYLEKKLFPENIKLNFVGRFSNEVKHLLAESSFGKSAEIIDYVNHSKAIGYLTSSDALLLIIDDTKDISKIIPGKAFEYIGARKPVIAIGNKGSDIDKILEETGCGKIAPHNNIQQIKDIISEYYNNFRSGKLSLNFKDEKINQYSRKTITAKLAEIFDSLSF